MYSPNDELFAMIDDCETRESRLTEWESGFIDSIRNQLEDGKRLSEKQEATLNNIWEKATAKG